MTVPLMPTTPPAPRRSAGGAGVQFDRAGAKAAGYSDSEIDAFLQSPAPQQAPTRAPLEGRARLKAAGFSDAEIDADQKPTPNDPARRARADRWEGIRADLIANGAADDRTTTQRTTALETAEHTARAGRTAPRQPNPKADRWDAAYAANLQAGMGAEAAGSAATRQVETEAVAAPAIARRGNATGVNQLTSGFTFGFTDEANAVGDVLIDKVTGRDSRPMGDVYRDRVAAERARIELYRQQNPGKSIALQLAGGLATGGVAALGRKALGGGAAAIAGDVIPMAPTLAARVGKGLATGVGAGALGGAGNSQGGLVSMLRDAAVGGGVGGVIGGTLPAAGALLGLLPRGARAVAGAVGTPPTGAVKVPVMGTPPGLTGAQTAATDAGTRVPATTDRAALRLARALAEGKLTPSALRTAATNARPSEIVADFAGAPAQRLVRASEAVPSTGGEELRALLTTRQSAQGDRITTDVARLFGLEGRPNLVTGARTLAASQRAAAQPLYEAAMMTDDGLRMVPRDVVAPFTEVPEFARAMQRAQRMFADDLRQGRVDAPADLFRDVVVDVGADGAPVVQLAADRVPLRVVDYMKKALDSMIGDDTPAGALDRTARASLIRDRNALLQSVDALVPEYGIARHAYRGGAALRSAFSQGQKAVQFTRDELADVLEGMAPAEATQFRMGAMGKLLEDVQSRADGQDAMAVVSKNRVLRDKMALLLPDDAARDEFTALVASEGRQSATLRSIGGSRTATLQQDIAGLTDDDAGGVASVLRGGVRGAVGSAMGAAADRLARAERTQMADQLAPLLSMTPAQVDVVLRRIAGAAGRRTESAARQRGAGAGVAGVAGGASARP